VDPSFNSRRIVLPIDFILPHDSTAFAVRMAQEKDLSGCATIFLSVRCAIFKWENSENFQYSDFQNSVKDEIIFVAETEGNIMGFVSVYQPYSFVHNLFVGLEYQGLGVGRALLDQVIRFVLPPITLKCVIQNTKACQFYEHCGWKKISTHLDENPAYYTYSFGSGSGALDPP
jgi:GNAT superfamily N-acetyltransferase